MSQAGPYLRETKVGFGHYCPNCDGIHMFWTKVKNRPKWTFNGNLEKPTFSPSMRVFHPAHVDEGVKVPEETLCHYILTDGILNYCGDFEGKHKNQKIPLPPLPERFSDANYHWGV